MPRIKGVRLPDRGAPRQRIEPCTLPGRVGLLGSDYPRLRLRPAVMQGDKINAGQVVMRDHRDPRLCVTSPLAGTVEEVVIGAKRRVARIVISRGEGATVSFDTGDAHTEAGLRKLMQDTGLWTGFLRRPFGTIPDPEERPSAILVTAIATEPGAADPGPLIRAEAEAFAAALSALEKLTEGPVFLCQSAGAELVRATGRVRAVAFSGAHPAGSPGLHAERLCPPSPDRPVCQMGYADVLALGAVLATGQLPSTKVVALSGPAARDPRLLELPCGADLGDLAAQETTIESFRILSGSSLSGREARFLRRRDTQVTLLPRDLPAAHGGASRRHMPALRRKALIPHMALARSLGPDLPAMALLRALSVGEADQAGRLGALGLLEEDMALATYLAGGGEDFGLRLRAVLDRLEAS